MIEMAAFAVLFIARARSSSLSASGSPSHLRPSCRTQIGGGFGPIGVKYGMVVDNMLEAHMVRGG